jgi:hypothetical protein
MGGGHREDIGNATTSRNDIDPYRRDRDVRAGGLPEQLRRETRLRADQLRSARLFLQQKLSPVGKTPADQSAAGRSGRFSRASRESIARNLASNCSGGVAPICARATSRPAPGSQSQMTALRHLRTFVSDAAKAGSRTPFAALHSQLGE